MSKSKTFDVLQNIEGLANFNLNASEDDASKDESVKENSSIDSNNSQSMEHKKEDCTVKEKEASDAKKSDLLAIASDSKKSDLLAIDSLRTPLNPPAKKQSKNVHKNFLITEYHYHKFKELAKQRNQSENALFNDMLEALFGKI